MIKAVVSGNGGTKLVPLNDNEIRQRQVDAEDAATRKLQEEAERTQRLQDANDLQELLAWWRTVGRP